MITTAIEQAKINQPAGVINRTAFVKGGSIDSVSYSRYELRNRGIATKVQAPNTTQMAAKT